MYMHMAKPLYIYIHLCMYYIYIITNNILATFKKATALKPTFLSLCSAGVTARGHRIKPAQHGRMSHL